MIDTMFCNLLAELARSGKTQKEVCDGVGMNYFSWKNKMHGKTEFTRSEMLKVKNTYFPDMSLDYLFTYVEKKNA